ncbi:RNA-binding protein [Candidatus Campbellbacteria bacterium]|nr:MAG: RNA-binding protein [Candidatus Campbellbacteria bacterium]
MYKIFVGNLAWEVGSQDLKEAFSKFGEVTDAFVATDKYSGRSRGFGFVTFQDEEAKKNALAEMQGFELKGREINVDEAHAKDDSNEA